MPALPPSSTIPSGYNFLSVRQNDDSSSSFTAVPISYKSTDNSLAPGVVAGIVLGSVAGFLLLLRTYEYSHGRYVDISEFPQQKRSKNEEQIAEQGNV
ncbi:hypothetical protein J7337_004668 [Fusarium musae]|uniref:Uncharacterized protein n=1 Tax=Fusarium musae TaxID=1042133 RepID=A0A9P8DMQ0_9HYPO|nr:hypothetical protein J7337_004668 [Fusarium musae]KAG9504693.1 hypothetical protein J7337_004668 [Fusarium musae]